MFKNTGRRLNKELVLEVIGYVSFLENKQAKKLSYLKSEAPFGDSAFWRQRFLATAH